VRLPVRLFIAALVIAALPARAQTRGFSDEEILGPRRDFVIESLRVRYTHLDQEGRGYQSQAERVLLSEPGSEQMSLEQPQLEVVAKQGRFTHRVWIPVDVVTAASPDAVDAVSTASRTNEAGTIDITHSYQIDRTRAVGLRYAFHIEEPFRSWQLGASYKQSFADDNTTLAASLNQVFDWFDRFDVTGARRGRAYRSSTNGNLSLTQLLSPTTVGWLTYGFTVQNGELSNTWNAVVTTEQGRFVLAREYLPELRHRHAFAGRLVQALPWAGVLKGGYRFYVDDWGILAHTLDLALYQRITRYVYLRGNYRFHHQSAAWFFTTGVAGEAPRTSDSDLAEFDAQTFGGLVGVGVPAGRRIQNLHLDFGYERYIRTNGLFVNIYTCSVAFRF
jgi:hypothetical protein